MRIIKPSFKVEFPLTWEHILTDLERIGRVCYKSECRITPESAPKFVKGILSSRHESVIEHHSITVRFICDRGISHEIVRHRLASYSQESTRYCDYGKAGEIQVIEPPNLTTAQRATWIVAMNTVEAAYNEMRKNGVTPQIARSVLPNALKTEIVMTANLREWRHFFRMRCAPSAHPQMREIAIPLLLELRKNIPVVFTEELEIAGVDYE